MFRIALILAAALPFAAGYAAASDTRDCAQVRELLSAGKLSGGKALVEPFMWRSMNGLAARAQNAGLEGFYWTKTELEEKFGEAAWKHHYDDYFGYADWVLAQQQWTGGLRKELEQIKGQKGNPSARNEKLNTFLSKTIKGLQDACAGDKPAAWVRKARIYQLFPRAYNLNGRRAASTGVGTMASTLQPVFFRDFNKGDFETIKEMGFDTIWPMGIFPVGEKNRSGNGGGSVFSIKDHSRLNPELGTEEDFKKFVRLAHESGMKVIIDLVPNHTSQDSAWLEENPDYYIGFKAELLSSTRTPKGYFSYKHSTGDYYIAEGAYDCGGAELCTWNDVAQLDFSKPALRQKMTEMATGWISKYDIDGFRVDMAYQDLNRVFARNWGLCMPKEEYFTTLIEAARKIKPSAAFIAEAYDNQDDLSAAGFDLFYNKSEWKRVEGQSGWYDAFWRARLLEVTPAISRAAFLAWQQGGAGGLSFFINHDEPSVQKIFGARLPAVAMLTMLLPGPVLFYNGTEIGFDASTPNESKTIPFSIPVQINWQGGDPEVKATFSKVFEEAAKLRQRLGDYDIHPLRPKPGEYWTGYVMISKKHPKTRVALIANPYNTLAPVSINDRRWDLTFRYVLKPGDFRIKDISQK